MKISYTERNKLIFFMAFGVRIIKDCLIFTFFDKVNYPVDKDTFIEISYENLMEWCEKINMVCHVENDKLSE